VPYLVHRAGAHQTLNELKAAISDYTRALELDAGPHSPVLHKMRGQLFARLGRLKEAEQDLEMAEGDEEAAQLLAAVKALIES
jgi:hypothetical protein